MEFIKKYFKGASLIKMIGLGLLGLVILVIVIWLIGFAFRSAFTGGGMAPSYAGYDDAYNQERLAVAQDASYDALGGEGKIIFPPLSGGSTGDDAEEYEITEYSGTIKTGRLEETCGEVQNLKIYDYVIFESSNLYDHACAFTFKVKKEKVEEILAFVIALDPDTFYTNVHTIKPAIEGFDSEIDILKKKLASIETTLRDAQRAYDEVQILATRAQNVEALATIIDSKINLIEKLTSERISVKEQIDRLSKYQLDQLDRLDYTYFQISVNEIVIVDGERLKDSWVQELRRFVTEVNEVIQGVTVGLASWIVRLVQVALYLIIALFIAKYGWRLTKYLWKF